MVLRYVMIITMTFITNTVFGSDRCLTRAYDSYRFEALARAAELPDHLRTTPTREPPDTVYVGAEWDWYIWDLSGMPAADLLPCTVRGMGEYCYVVVENSQWNVTVNQEDVDIVVERFNNSSPGPLPDKGIYEINTEAFGDPPDALDNDPKIYILYYDFQISADGYFWIFDQYPDGTQPFSSNECEVIYLNSGAADPGGDYLLAVGAHEFQHMIHFNHDPDEASWVDEGLAEVAMYLYGHPDNVSSFPAYPDNNLTQWNGSWADYIKTYLWTLYVYEHYGQQQLTWDLVHEPANSMAGYDSVFAQLGFETLFEDVFLDWIVANFIDDEEFEDGRYGYIGEDLPGFARVQYESYPVGPVNTTVNHWATDYQLYKNGTNLSYDFDGADANDFAIRIIRRNTGTTIDVSTWVPGAGQAGSFSLPDFGIYYEDAVMAITSISNSGANGYQYSADADPAGIPPITDLTIQNQGSNTILSWSPRPGATTYLVYWSDSPFFDADTVSPMTVTETGYTDVGAVVPDQARFYVVRGRNFTTQSMDSNRAGGEFYELTIP